MDIKTKATAAAMVMALASQPVAAQEATPKDHSVAVALIDVGANSLTSKDPNVSFVDLTPNLKDGLHHASGRVGSKDHGDVVAQAFVDEYRKIDPDAKITFYTVNPFIQKGMFDGMMFSRSMLNKALPKMQEANVKVAITTFGVSDEKAGNTILSDIEKAGMIVFAATPNEKGDDGIWPAASASTIAVADGTTRDSGFKKSAAWSNWVDVVADGYFHDKTITVSGSSFATPRAAAYGVYYASKNPECDVTAMKSALRESAEPVKLHGRQFPEMGSGNMVDNIKVVAERDAAPRETKKVALAQQMQMQHEAALSR